ncbi:molybdopterin-guanine dinucleotide biosynthesis protein B [Ornithinibacillus scapharcae]|uniref:molybdopterin-guanine dinucleotide biosynthesis protein B n=1 Tax=Ornithinibacillus scapharcae TaxID=1147159 RepID=UPI000225B6C3|nr:molybdopterin-guanine dinucleotide biosynthesis protein B [Ornithinibacillus scapharcae]
MKVFQIVGYKNSGKTTFTKELITYLSARGIVVGSLKNHGHGGLPIGIEDSDSEQHRAAGSAIAGVIGDGMLQLSHATHWKVDDIFLVYEKLGTDILIVEGFKRLPFPKIVLLRKEEESPLLVQLENIKGVMKPKEVNVNSFSGAIFHDEDRKKAIEWIYNSFQEGII